tara:strand:+ start:1189 stop:1497 length:309 start_codon:yes stop_codon:yes gene_type:complete
LEESLSKPLPEVMEFWERLAELNPNAIRFDNFDQALIGMVYVYGSPPIAAYDRDRCIGILMRDGMTVETAEEYFQYNTEHAHFGDGTPAFLDAKIEWKTSPP